MLQFAADENLNGKLFQGLLRHRLDVVRVQDAGLAGADDPSVLAWAAQERRIVLTHDLTTMPRYASERVEAGHGMPGLFAVRRGFGIGRILDDLVLLAECSRDAEWEGRTLYLPL